MSGTHRTLRRRYLLLTALRWLPIGAATSVVTLLMLDRGIALANVGLPLAAYSLTALVLEVPTGLVADVIGRRSSVLAGAVFSVAGAVVVVAAPEVATMTLGWVLLGIGRALDSGALDAWYIDAFHASGGTDPEDDLAVVGVAGAGALALGGLVAGGLLAVTDGALVAPWIAAVVGGIVHLVASAALIEEAPHGHASPWAAIRRGLAPALRSGAAVVRASVTLRLLLLAMALYGTVFVAVESLWQPRLTALRPQATWELGALTALAFGAAALGAALLPRLRHRLPGQPTSRAAVTALLYGAALAATAATPGVAGFAAGYGAFYLFAGAINPMHKTALHAEATAAVRATVLSADAFALQVGGITGSLVWPRLAAATSIRTAWTVAAVAAAFVALPYAAAAARRRATAVATAGTTSI